jgi:hypothetical protein
MSTIDNQSHLSIHCYVVHNWVTISICISSDKMLEGLGSDNLTKVVMEALTIWWGVAKGSNCPKAHLLWGKWC